MKNLKKLIFTVAASILILPLTGHQAQADLYITIVQGLGGNIELQEGFDKQSADLAEASHSITSPENVNSFTGSSATRPDILDHFSQLAVNMNDNDRAVIYLIGHGSFDGEQYKFNIPGPDLTSTDLKSILDGLPGQNHVLVNTSSSSGAMLEPLENPSHILISATKNGNEKNAPQFPVFFVQGLSSETADLNKNNNISVQEAFDYAENEVAQYFESAGRLATEHPQIQGDAAARFTLAKINPVEIDSDIQGVEKLFDERLAIDSRIEDLQLNRARYSNDDYIKRLQALILEAANISEEIEKLEADSGDSSASN